MADPATSQDRARRAVIAIVASLLRILTDPDRREVEKFDSLRRAVRLLGAFVAGKDTTRT